jgi:ParB family transcriptional regulator, chromosome partitioning protein
MTSGQFTSFPVDSIQILRDQRQRRELTGIQELAWSINSSGLINPIVIKRDGELVAGERRLTAAKSLGWTHINVQFMDDLDEASRHLIELEENVRRVDLTWQDQCRAIDQYHKLRSSQDDTWTAKKTASALGFTEAEVSQKRAIAAELERGNERVAAAPKLSVARGIVSRESERKRDSAIAAIEEEITGEAPATPEAPIILGDFNEWVKVYSGPKFNFLHCDFPYGVNADRHNQGAASAFGGYADSEDVYWRLLESLGNAMENVVAESAHLLFWFSMDFYQPTVEKLSSMGWDVQRFPIIWHKSDNVGILPDPSRGPRRIYETALIASRGDRKIIRAVSNVVSSPTSKRIHMSEKPIPVLTKFMEMFVDQYSVVLDPTCGSANALKAAEIRGASKVLGIEQNEEFYERAKGAYYGNEEGSE